MIILRIPSRSNRKHCQQPRSPLCAPFHISRTSPNFLPDSLLLKIYRNSSWLWIYTLYYLYVCSKYFIPLCDFHFHSLNVIFWCTEVINIQYSPVYYFMIISALYISLRNLPLPNIHLQIRLYFVIKVLLICFFPFISIILQYYIFVYSVK